METTVVETAGARPRRRTQAERSAATRAALLDATVALLSEVGATGTTTSAVAERAGVSRGAHLHHYGTRAELLVAAVAHLAALRQREVEEALDASEPLVALERLATAFAGPLFLAALELWVAARTDTELRPAVVRLERDVGTRLSALAALVVRRHGGGVIGVRDPRDRDPGEVADLADLTVDLLRGLGVAVLLSPDAAARRRRTRLLAAWSARLSEATAAPAPRRPPVQPPHHAPEPEETP